MSTSSTDLPNQRVSYRNGILLDASDFQQEQRYHRSRLGAALARIHGFGTIAGLRVRREAGGPISDATTGDRNPEEKLIVERGIALDRLGRLVEIETEQSLRLHRWFRYQVSQPAAALKPFVDGSGQRYLVGDLFLHYNEHDQGLRPGFPEPAADSTDAVVPARTNDSYHLRLVVRDCDPETSLPATPTSRFATPPADKAAMLEQVFDAYAPSNAVLYAEYPADYKDKTAVFLARVRIRLSDTAGSLDRHSTHDVVVDQLARPLVASTDLLRQLLPA